MHDVIDDFKSDSNLEWAHGGHDNMSRSMTGSSMADTVRLIRVEFLPWTVPGGLTLSCSALSDQGLSITLSEVSESEWLFIISIL